MEQLGDEQQERENASEEEFGLDSGVHSGASSGF